MSNKLGTYISKLMTTIIDKEQDEFVKELALGELKRLNGDITDFTSRHSTSEIEDVKKTEKILLQEKKNAE